MRPRRSTAAAILIVVMALAGCDSERLDQFSAFATAGSQYVAAFHKLIEQAGSAMIAVDSATLLVAHNQVSSDIQENPGKYAKDVIEHDRQLQTSLATLELIDHHATLLGSYFNALCNLTDSKAAAGTTAAATDLLNQIAQLNPKVANANFMGKGVKDFVNAGTPVIVAHFQVKALDEQLIKAQPVIEQALALQQAAVAVISAGLKADLGDTLQLRETNEVVNPFLQPTVPGNWAANREAVLRAKVTLENVDSAQAAINQLNIAFKQLVEHKNSSVDLTSLLNAISKMSGFTGAAESGTKTTNAGKPAK